MGIFKELDNEQVYDPNYNEEGEDSYIDPNQLALNIEANLNS